MEQLKKKFLISQNPIDIQQQKSILTDEDYLFLSQILPENFYPEQNLFLRIVLAAASGYFIRSVNYNKSYLNEMFGQIIKIILTRFESINNPDDSNKNSQNTKLSGKIGLKKSIKHQSNKIYDKSLKSACTNTTSSSSYSINTTQGNNKPELIEQNNNIIIDDNKEKIQDDQKEVISNIHKNLVIFSNNKEKVLTDKSDKNQYALSNVQQQTRDPHISSKIINLDDNNKPSNINKVVMLTQFNSGEFQNNKSNVNITDTSNNEECPNKIDKRKRDNYNNYIKNNDIEIIDQILENKNIIRNKSNDRINSTNKIRQTHSISPYDKTKMAIPDKLKNNVAIQSKAGPILFNQHVRLNYVKVKSPVDWNNDKQPIYGMSLHTNKDNGQKFWQSNVPKLTMKNEINKYMFQVDSNISYSDAKYKAFVGRLYILRKHGVITESENEIEQFAKKYL